MYDTFALFDQITGTLLHLFFYKGSEQAAKSRENAGGFSLADSLLMFDVVVLAPGGKHDSITKMSESRKSSEGKGRYNSVSPSYPSRWLF